MPDSDRSLMLGLAPCPNCQYELAAPLGAAGRVARCTECLTRFVLPPARALYSNAAAFLLMNHVEEMPHDQGVRDDVKRSA